MADNIFRRLGRLFQSQVIIRKTDDDKLIVKDLDHSQKSYASNFIDRYDRLVQQTYNSPYSLSLIHI